MTVAHQALEFLKGHELWQVWNLSLMEDRFKDSKMKPYLTKAEIAQRYPTDLTDEQWERLEPCLPAAKPGGRPRKIDLRQVLNGILYLERAGCAWPPRKGPSS